MGCGEGMSKPTITISLHPYAYTELKREAEKYKTTPQKIIKDLLRRYYEIDCDTGEHPVYTKVRE